MARGGEAEKAFLRPVAGGRGHAGRPDRGMARHQRLAGSNAVNSRGRETKMDVIERYLEAVAAQLSVEDREDIVAELRDLILSRIEAREEELNRALNDEEKEAI